MKKRLFIFLFISALILSVLAGCGGEAEDEGEEVTGNNVVRIYNYGVYIDPDVITMFEEETGYTVVYDVFDTNEEMYTVISSSSVSYDVVCASEYMVEKMRTNDLLTELDYKDIPNTKYLSDDYLMFAEQFDPEHNSCVPYSWGTLGYLYNPRLLEDEPPTSWNDLWDEKYFDNIMMMDSLRDLFAAALKKNGYSLNSVNEAELREATDDMIKQKSIVYKYATDAIRDFMLNESSAIGMIYSGEALYCQEDDEDMVYVLPEEGSNVWFDCWTVPKNASNVEGALKFIDFMSRPDIALKTYEFLHYSSPNAATIEMVKELYPEDLENQALFPDEESLAKCEVFHYLGPDADKLYNKLWKDFKAS